MKKRILTLLGLVLSIGAGILVAQPVTKVYLTNSGDKLQVASGGTLDVASGGTLSISGTVTRASQEYQAGFGPAKAGTTAGWVVAVGANLYEWTLPQSQTASTLVIPISGLRVGDTITAYKCEAQIESAGGAVTLDTDLRSLTNVAADPTDASVGATTQVSVTADTKAEPSKTGLSDVVAADERFYILATATTAASTDIRFLGCTVTVTTG